MDNEKIYSCSCQGWKSSEMPPIQNPVDKTIHFCVDPVLAAKYERLEEEEDGDCIGRKDGSFWIVNEEYSDVQVRFCPHCGLKAPKQDESTCD